MAVPVWWIQDGCAGMVDPRWLCRYGGSKMAVPVWLIQDGCAGMVDPRWLCRYGGSKMAVPVWLIQDGCARMIMIMSPIQEKPKHLHQIEHHFPTTLCTLGNI
jgi:hypothetical protein